MDVKTSIRPRLQSFMKDRSHFLSSLGNEASADEVGATQESVILTGFFCRVPKKLQSRRINAAVVILEALLNVKLCQATAIAVCYCSAAVYIFFKARNSLKTVIA